MLLIEDVVFYETVFILLEGDGDDETKRRKIIDAIKKKYIKNRYLTFTVGNLKLGENVLIFSLPAGWTCPYGKICKVLVDRAGGNKKLANTIKHMCYAAWEEIMRPNVRKSRWRNLDLLEETKTHEEMVDLIYRSIKYNISNNGSDIDYVRIHESGDFYDGKYLHAWVDVAKKMPYLEFYAYTKSLPIIEKYSKIIDDVNNFKINLSSGSDNPELEGILNYPVVNVFQTPEEVLQVGQLIDLDDSIAYDRNNINDFALLIHGNQPKELGIPNISKDSKRNSVFLKYYKNKNKLLKIFQYDINHRMTNDEAKNEIITVNEIFKKNKINKNTFENLISSLKNVIAFNNYNFSDELINVIPPKFR